MMWPAPLVSRIVLEKCCTRDAERLEVAIAEMTPAWAARSS